MLQAMFVAALLPVIAGAPRGEEKPVAPKTLPPRAAFAIVNERGALLVEDTVQRRVPETRVRKVQINGQVREETITVFVPVFVSIQRAFPISAKGLQAFDKDGQRINIEDLAKRLQKRTAILISADGKKVHPSFLKKAKAETVILVLPKAEAIPAPKPLPAPKIADKG